MTLQRPAIRFVLYSEDRTDANNGYTVLREVLRGMLKHIRPDVKLNHVLITPLQPVPKKRICGSYWKVTPQARDPGAHEFRRQLILDVATEIRLGRVVFFHVDADEVWRRRTVCENECEHWPRLIRDVRSVLSRPGQTAVTQNALTEMLVLAMPFYEMESWAFANISYLRKILANPKDLAFVDKWAADLSQLDEEPNTKDCLSIGPEKNEDLVQLKNNFPVTELATLGRSYAETLGRLRDSQIVLAGLDAAAQRPF